MPEAPAPPRPERSPHWVRTSPELAQLATHVQAAGMVALDTESDSLHHFPEKVCLIQVSTRRGEAFLVDPLALRDLSPLEPVLADRSVVTILHGAAYDLASMRRDFGFTVRGLFDTMVAAQFLGLPELGLASLLERLLGVRPGESRQKDDWAARPLSAAQEHYAAEDVRHLIDLRASLLTSLEARGRAAWAAEECEALEATPAADRVFDPDDCLAIRGARLLDRRGLGILRELFVSREAWAHERGRPPFKILGNDTLLRLAAMRPDSLSALDGIPGCTPTVIGRYGEGVLRAIARGRTLGEADLPDGRRGRKPQRGPGVERRMAALLAWRADAAPRLGLDPGLVLPRRLIERLAEDPPGGASALEAVEGMRRWRVAAFGAGILAALSRGASTPARAALGGRDRTAERER